MKATETFKLVTPATFGAGSVAGVGAELKSRGCKKVLLFHGKSVEKAGLSKKLKDLIEADGIEVLDCNESEPDPTEAMVNKVGNMAREAGVDGVVAVGGGSAIDAAKGIKVLLNNPGEIREYFLGSQKVQLSEKPLIAIPTTSGTGTEVDRAAMITDSQNGSKRVLIGLGATPDAAIVDPELTVTCPPKTTAGCAFDAFGHCVDGVTGKLATDSVRLIGFHAIQLIYDNLDAALEDGNNLDARTGLQMASMMGGISIANANCSVAHSMAHALGAAFHVAHGNCVAIFTPACLEFVAEESATEIRKIAEIVGVDLTGKDTAEAAAHAVAEALYRWYRKAGLANIAELVPDREEAKKLMVPLSIADVNWRFGRRDLDEAGAAWIIDRAYDMAEELK